MRIRAEEQSRKLSWQPPNPSRNASLFVLPYPMKALISRLSPTRDGTLVNAPVGYISNVLVWKMHRGHGYGRILMAALEGIAKMWDCMSTQMNILAG